MAKILVNLLQTTGTKGGIEIYAHELYKQLGELNSDNEFVGLVSKELATKELGWFPGETINSGISGENRFTWAAGELFAVSSHAHKINADLIHGPAMFGPAKSKIPAVVSLHDVLYFSHPHLMQNKLYTQPVKFMEQLGAKNATRIITISEYSARGIQKYLKVPESKIDVIPLAGRNTDNSSGLSQEARNGPFLAVGQRSPYKNLETVVNGWANIPEAIRPQLVITGSHGEDPLAPLVEHHQLQNWVTLKSWVDEEELANLFNKAPAIIDSTLATGFSMPTLEAMAIGLPVVLADTEVFREVGENAATYFEPGNPIDLARVVTRLIENPQELGLLSRAGLQRSQLFSWKRVAQETLISFEKAMKANES